MSSKNKRIRHPQKSRKSSALNSPDIVVIIQKDEKETLFPGKLKKMNEMLSKTKFLDS